MVKINVGKIINIPEKINLLKEKIEHAEWQHRRVEKQLKEINLDLQIFNNALEDLTK